MNRSAVASLLVLISLPAFASTIVTTICDTPLDYVENSGTLTASCSIDNSPDYAAGAQGSITVGGLSGLNWALSLMADSGGIFVGGNGTAEGSFTLTFAYPTTITWDLGVEFGALGDVDNASLQLGPVSLNGQQIYNIASQFPNAGEFVQLIPAGEWTFSGRSYDSNGDSLTLTGTVDAIATPEPSAVTFLFSAPAAMAFRLRARDMKAQTQKKSGQNSANSPA